MMKYVLSFLVLYFCTPAWVNAGTPETLSVKAKALPDYCYTNRNHPCWANAHPSNGLPGIPMDLNLGKGCRVAITLLNGEVNRVGGDPEMQMGGFHIEPLPKNWKSRLDSLGFNLYCKSTDDPSRLQTWGVFDEKANKWVKDISLMRDNLTTSTSDYEREFAEEIIATTHVYDIKTPNANGWAQAFEDLNGAYPRSIFLKFCLFNQGKTICGSSRIGYVWPSPKKGWYEVLSEEQFNNLSKENRKIIKQMEQGKISPKEDNLIPHALKIIHSIEFLPDAAPSEETRQ